MPPITTMNPFRCRMWEYHDRLEAHISEESCRAEIASLSTHGQFVPVIGRPLRGDSSYDAELITGARRLFVARHLNKLLAVELRDLSDKEALIAMDTENRLRKDISPYERALSYSQWLRSGLFKSQDEIAHALKISPSQVSRILRLAQLPAVVVEAFHDPTELREDWGRNLAAKLEDANTKRALLDTARSIVAQSKRCPAKDVYRQLLAASAKGRKPKPRHHDVVVRSEGGATLFRIRHQRDAVALLLPVENLAEPTLRNISDVLATILQAASRQVVDSRTTIRAELTESRLSSSPQKTGHTNGPMHLTPILKGGGSGAIDQI